MSKTRYSYGANTIDQEPPGLFKAHNSSPKGPQGAVNITSAVGGNLSKLTFKKTQHQRRFTNQRSGGGKRTTVKGISDASRLRLKRRLASVNYPGFDGAVLFITLTYPEGGYPTEHELWQRDLQCFKQRLFRRHKGISGFWRLELSKRDSPDLHPHFHLLLFSDVPYRSLDSLAEFRSFIALSWYEVCGKLCEDHLKAGTQVKKVNSPKYWDLVSKYISKKEKLQDESLITGRVWGVWKNQLLPITWETVKVTFKDALKIRRYFRRLAGSKPIGSLLRQQVFIRYENMGRLLTFLGYNRG